MAPISDVTLQAPVGAMLEGQTVLKWRTEKTEYVPS